MPGIIRRSRGGSKPNRKKALKEKGGFEEFNNLRRA